MHGPLELYIALIELIHSFVEAQRTEIALETAPSCSIFVERP